MFDEVYSNNMNSDNEVNVLINGDIDEYLTSDLRTDDVMDELHHDSNEEGLSIITDYSPITIASHFDFEVEV